MPLGASHFESMVEAVIVVYNPGHDPRWPLARVAGLPAIERNLMALRSIGAGRVRLACGPGEYDVLAAHFAHRRPDARLPLVSLAHLDAPATDASVLPADGQGRDPSALGVDGRRVYHPEMLRCALPRGGPADEAGEPSIGPDAPLYSEDITTPAGRRRARRAIRQSLRKPTDGWFARTIDRSFSLAISAVLAPLPIHPNAVTIATLLVAIAAGLLAARGTYGGSVAGAALFLLASVLDGVDGEMARMKFQSSHAGEWLDTACDDVSNAVYLAGVTAGAWRAFSSRLLLWTGVAAVALDVVVVSFLYWQLLTKVNGRTLLAFEETLLAPALEEPGAIGFVARLQPFVKRDVYAPLFLVFALAGVAWLSLPATTVALTITLVFVLRDFVRGRSAGAGARAA